MALVWGGGVMLSGLLAVLPAPMFDGLSLDLFTLFDDGSCPSEVGVGEHRVSQALSALGGKSGGPVRWRLTGCEKSGLNG